jgi:A118 family predicted phage portal protein
MFKNLWEWILVNIFKVKTQTDKYDIQRNDKYVEDYKKIDEINFTSIFSNKLANYTINDSTFSIEGSNKRASYFSDMSIKLWKKLKKVIDMAYGIGGMALIPYVKNNKVYWKPVEQNRITIDEIDGDVITGATVLMEVKSITILSSKTTYMRWTNYKVENGNIVITQKYTNDNGKEIETPSFWIDIDPIVTISNVDRVLFGFIKCPRNNRRTDDKYGVPITYGCESTIEEIKDCLKQIAREYKNKEVFVGADKRMFNGDNKLPTTGVYKKINGENKDGSSFWEIFDPSIRDSSFYNRLEELYYRLEHEISTSGGVLTKPEPNKATATEIKSDNYDTFSIIDDMRTNIEDGLDDFFYSCDVYANALTTIPMGQYQLSFDWDYSLIEDSTEQFNQITTGVDKGVVKKSELRNWIKPNETIEESEKAVEEARKDSIKDLKNIIEMSNADVIDREKAIDLLFGDTITLEERLRLIASAGEISFAKGQNNNETPIEER